MIEFVLIAPILFGVLFAIIEFGWTYYQILDTRHGAREGARLVAVNYAPGGISGTDQRDALIAEICALVEESTGTRVEITFADTTKTEAGDTAVVRVERDLVQLTNFYDVFLNSVVPSSDVTFRLERDASWAATAGTPQACP